MALREMGWRKEAIWVAFKATLTSHKLKMPHLAMPVRLLVAGTTHTPSLDAVLMLFGRETVLARLEKGIAWKGASGRQERGVRHREERGAVLALNSHPHDRTFSEA